MEIQHHKICSIESLPHAATFRIISDPITASESHSGIAELLPVQLRPGSGPTKKARAM
jgi:hypothetical protein